MEYAIVAGVKWAKLCFMVHVREITGPEKWEDIVVTFERTVHCGFRWAKLVEVEDVVVMTEGQRGVMRAFLVFEGRALTLARVPNFDSAWLAAHGGRLSIATLASNKIGLLPQTLRLCEMQDFVEATIMAAWGKNI
jgi:hypothetical protein